MPDYVIEDLDSCNIKVKCERHHAKELSDFFTFKVPGHKFMPSYRKEDGTGKSNYTTCIHKKSVQV